MTTRYIVFNGAPTIRECKASIDRGIPAAATKTTIEWDSFEFEFNDPTISEENSQGPRKEGDVWDTSGSQFKDAESPQRQKRGLSVEQSGPDNEEKNKRRRTTTTTTTHYEGDESMCQSFFMFPPPSQQPRRRSSSGSCNLHTTRSKSQRVASQSQGRKPPDETTFDVSLRTRLNQLDQAEGGNETTFARHYNLTSIIEGGSSPPPQSPQKSSEPKEEEDEQDSSYLDSSSLELSIGPPPALPWAIHDLSKLDQLRTMYQNFHSHSHHPHHDSSSNVIVSILGIISSLSLKETSNHGSLCEIVLEDETGGIVKLIAWGKEQAEELNQALRIGDVVYFGKVKLLKSKFNQALELRLIEGVSRVGISFRTRVFDEELDGVYRFDRVWARELEQARAVIEIVDWWIKNRE